MYEPKMEKKDDDWAPRAPPAPTPAATAPPSDSHACDNFVQFKFIKRTLSHNYLSSTIISFSLISYETKCQRVLPSIQSLNDKQQLGSNASLIKLKD